MRKSYFYLFSSLVPFTLFGVDYTWQSATSADWQNNASWSPSSGFPNSVTDTATLPSNVAVLPIDITLTADTTVLTINMDTSMTTYYTIAPQTTEKFLVVGGETMTVSSTGNNTSFIAADFNVGAGGTLSLNPSAPLMISGSLVANPSPINQQVFLSGTSTVTVANSSIPFYGMYNTGTFAFGPMASVGDISLIDMRQGTFDISGSAATVQVASLTNLDLMSTNGGTVNLGSQTIKLAPTFSTTYNGSIIGSGNLILDGVGPQILTGASSFTGTTTITTGTLKLSGAGSIASSSSVSIASGATLDLSAATSGVTIKNLSGAGNVTTGSQALTVNQTSPGTLSGAIQTGAGAFNKTGISTLTLSGTNTYTGGTTVSGGTLALSLGGSIADSSSVSVDTGATLDLSAATSGVTIKNLSGAGNVTTGSQALTVNQSSPGTLSGAIQTGAGAFNKTGTSTLTLSGTNTYTGGTTVSGGTLALSLGGSIADSSSVSVDTGATLDLSGATSGVTIKNLSGAGNVTTGSQALTVNQSTPGTLSGAIQTGGGAFNKTGTSTLTLSGTNTYTGGTTVSGGTLALSLGGSIASSSSLTIGSGATFDISSVVSASIKNLSGAGNLKIDGSTLTVNQIGNGTFSGAIEAGMGTFIKSGSSTLILSGNSLFSGAIDVSEGTLAVTGDISATSSTVSFGAVLQGNGTVGTLIIDGTLNPTDMVGRGGHFEAAVPLLSGPVTFHPGSTFLVEITPSNFSQLIVDGAAALDGSVEVTAQAGNYGQSGDYEILTATSISGAFSPTVLGGISNYAFSLSQIGNSIHLLYQFVAPTTIPTSNLSGNALRVADYLNENGSDSTLSLLNNLTGSTLKNALDSVSPARNAFPTYIGAQMAFSIGNIISSHMDGFRFSGNHSSQDRFASILTADSSDKIEIPILRSKNKLTAWITGFGEYAHESASLQNPSFRFISESALAGLDYQGENRCLVGGSLGYAHTDYHESGHAGHGDINYYFVSLYSNRFFGQFYVSPVVWGIFNQAENTRHISFPGFSENAYADIVAWQLIPHLEVGYEVKRSWCNIFWFTAADWAISWQRGYQEHGASPFNANEKAHRSSMLRSETGLKFSETWEKSWGAFYLKEKLSYVFETPFGTGTVNTAFAGTPSSFTVTAVNQDLKLGALGLNFLVALGKENPVKLDLGYEGEFGAKYWSNNLMLTLSKSF